MGPPNSRRSSEPSSARGTIWGLTALRLAVNRDILGLGPEAALGCMCSPLAACWGGLRLSRLCSEMLERWMPPEKGSWLPLTPFSRCCLTKGRTQLLPA